MTTARRAPRHIPARCVGRFRVWGEKMNPQKPWDSFLSVAGATGRSAASGVTGMDRGR
jgi:hypothetical protein